MTTDLAVPEGKVITPAERASAATELAEAGSIHSWLVVMRDVTLLAEHIADTQFVPKAIRGNPAAVAAAILAGMELGLPPMTALRHVQVVEGSPGLSAEYKRARVLAAGHKLDITEHTTEACTVTGHRRGHEPVTVRYTIQDARRAGLVKERGAYMTRPRRMLFARASTEVVDALFADLTNGLPTTELLEEEAEQDTVDAGPAQAPRATAADIAARRTVQSNVITDPSPAGAPQQDVPPSPAEAPIPPAAAQSAGEAPTAEPGTDAYRQLTTNANDHFKRLGWARAGEDDERAEDRAKRMEYVSRIVGFGPVQLLGDLTAEDLTVLGDGLSRCRNQGALDKMLAAGEAPSG